MRPQKRSSLIRSTAGSLSVLCLPLLLLAAGCGVTLGKGADPSRPAPTQPPPVATESGSITISPRYAATLPGGTVHFTASSSSGGQIQWLVNGVAGGSGATGTIDDSGHYTAPAFLPQSENVTITAALAASPQQDYATAITSVINSGIVIPTDNPQVAEYSMYLPAAGGVTVNFGKTISYGLDTSSYSTPSSNGGQVNVLVAGMLGQTSYHMQADVTLADGATLTDIDHSFTTGIPPVTSHVFVTTNGTPQPGIEMWNTLIPSTLTQVFATDLKGNVIWTYTYKGSPLDTIQGIQLLPNGHLLLLISYLSSLTSAAVDQQPTTLNLVREIDLAGNTVRQITMDQLNKSLAEEGYDLTLKSFHHNVLALPNGHWVLMAAYPKPDPRFANGILGDVLVDVDQNSKPDWVWNAFDHLDINRHPMAFPDWTHSNYMLYSPDDHNLLLSMRHQNWIIKIDFEDGKGSGNVIWRLGEGGDFKLENGTDPTDWFYAQHGMGFFSPNTTGVFKLGLMDNGNDRIFPSGQILCKPGQATTPQCYSTFPVFEIDESNMTATLIHHYEPGPKYFSFFGGNAEQLANGDMQVDFCAAANGSIVQELDPTASKVIWQATTPNADQFHVDRLPSLYPGVQW